MGLNNVSADRVGKFSRKETFGICQDNDDNCVTAKIDIDERH